MGTLQMKELCLNRYYKEEKQIRDQLCHDCDMGKFVIFNSVPRFNDFGEDEKTMITSYEDILDG